MENFGWKSMLVVCWTLPVGFIFLGRFVPGPVSVKAFVSLAVFVLFYGIVFVSYTVIVISLIKQRKRVSQINATSPVGSWWCTLQTHRSFLLPICTMNCCKPSISSLSHHGARTGTFEELWWARCHENLHLGLSVKFRLCTCC